MSPDNSKNRAIFAKGSCLRHDGKVKSGGDQRGGRLWRQVRRPRQTWQNEDISSRFKK
jgi:hypothetical protein